MQDKDKPLWRSMLYVPATSEKFIEKAHERGADAIKIDLEDAVAPKEKDTARKLVKDAAQLVSRGSADVLVRSIGHYVWRLPISNHLFGLKFVGWFCQRLILQIKLIFYVKLLLSLRRKEAWILVIQNSWC